MSSSKSPNTPTHNLFTPVTFLALPVGIYRNPAFLQRSSPLHYILYLDFRSIAKAGPNGVLLCTSKVFFYQRLRTTFCIQSCVLSASAPTLCIQSAVLPVSASRFVHPNASFTGICSSLCTRKVMFYQRKYAPDFVQPSNFAHRRCCCSKIGVRRGSSSLYI